LADGARLDLVQGTHAGIWVTIDGGTIVSARVEFTRPVRFQANPNATMLFRQLRVGPNGEVDPIDLDFDYPLPRLLLSRELPKIRELISQRIRISTDLSAMFVEGKVFAPQEPGQDHSLAIPNQLRATTPARILVADVSSRLPLAAGESELRAAAFSAAANRARSPLAEKILSVTGRINSAGLRQGAVLLLHEYDRPDAVRRTRVVIGPDSVASIPYAYIQPSLGTLQATIELALTTLDSSIFTQDRRFEFGSGSRLIARAMSFERTPSSWAFTNAPGSGYAELALKGGDFGLEGSQLTLASTGSSIVLYSLDLSGASGKPLEFKGSGRIALKIDSGSLHFNTLPGGIGRSYLALSGGSQIIAEGALSPVQSGREGAWSVRDAEAQINLGVEDGVFDLGPAGVVLCGSGTHLESLTIKMDTRHDRDFYGTMDLVRIENIRASLRGKPLASSLHLDPESFLLLGDNSTLTLSGAQLTLAPFRIQGSLSGTLTAVGGKLKYGSSLIALAEKGSSIDFKEMLLDTAGKRFLSGTLDRISCVVESTRLNLGSYIRDLSLAAGSKATISPLLIDDKTGHVHGSLNLLAEASGGGTLAVGPGSTVFPIKSGSLFKASDLTLDSDDSAPVHGTIQSAIFSTEGGQIDLAALRSRSDRTGFIGVSDSDSLSRSGGTGFIGVSGSVSLSDVSLPQSSSGSKGRAFFGNETASQNVTFTGGRFDLGPADLWLRTGKVRGALTWATDKSTATTFRFAPSHFTAEISTQINPLVKTIGTNAQAVPCVLSTGKLSISGGMARWNVGLDAGVLEGRLQPPFVQSVNGLISLECLDSISLDGNLNGNIYIPCDGDAEEGGAKVYPQSLAVKVNLKPGWRLVGSLSYAQGTTPSINLAEASGNPIALSVVNRSQNGTRPLVQLVDGRKMVDVLGCARVTVSWHANSTWEILLKGVGAKLAENKLTISATLDAPSGLTVNKHDPSPSGLSWNGSDGVEDLDDFLEFLDGMFGVGPGSITEVINKIIAQKIFPAIQEKISSYELTIMP
jgi:hypothetical protein